MIVPTKTILTGSALIVLGILIFPSSAWATCNANPEKFFPTPVITAATGELVLSTSANNLAFNEGCIYRFQSGGVSASVRKFNSASQAAETFKANYSKNTKLDIGEMAAYLGGNLGGVAVKGPYLLAIKDYGYSLNQSQIESLLKYALDQAPEEPKPPEPPPPVNTQKISMSPNTVSAGVAIGMDEEGVVNYGDNVLALTLKGEDLRNISIETDNPGIKVENITLSDNLTARVYVRVRPEAREGKTQVTVTQDGQPPVTLTLRVTIDGSQYLNRALNEEGAILYGHWEETAPNKEVVDLKLEIEKGLRAVSGPAYQKLDLKYHIYKSDVWKIARAKYCVDSTYNIGCAPAGLKKKDVYLVAGVNNTTSIDLNNPFTGSASVARLILHESAHKLHEAQLNIFDFLGGPVLLQSKFTKAWLAAYGTVNEKTCKHLPIVRRVSWKDNTKYPKCGFVVPYAASDYMQRDLTTRFQEDIATFTEALYFSPALRKVGDFPTDPRYKQKEAILKKYGFL